MIIRTIYNTFRYSIVSELKKKIFKLWTIHKGCTEFPILWHPPPPCLQIFIPTYMCPQFLISTKINNKFNCKQSLKVSRWMWQAVICLRLFIFEIIVAACTANCSTALFTIRWTFKIKSPNATTFRKPLQSLFCPYNIYLFFLLLSSSFFVLMIPIHFFPNILWTGHTKEI